MCHSIANSPAIARHQSINVSSINLSFIHDHAEKVLKDTTIDYLKTAKPCGSLFQNDCETGVVSSVFTNFFVDHAEPLAALDGFKDSGWCLGELLDGHEFLVILPVTTKPVGLIDFTV